MTRSGKSQAAQKCHDAVIEPFDLRTRMAGWIPFAHPPERPSDLWILPEHIEEGRRPENPGIIEDEPEPGINRGLVEAPAVAAAEFREVGVVHFFPMEAWPSVIGRSRLREGSEVVVLGSLGERQWVDPRKR